MKCASAYVDLLVLFCPNMWQVGRLQDLYSHAAVLSVLHLRQHLPRRVWLSRRRVQFLTPLFSSLISGNVREIMEPHFIQRNLEPCNLPKAHRCCWHQGCYKCLGPPSILLRHLASHRIAELTSDALAWPGPMRAVWHGTASLRMAAQSSTEIYAKS